MNRRWMLIILALLLLAAAGWGYVTYRNQTLAKQQAAEAAKEQATQIDLQNVIWASGKLEPVTWAGLSPATNGTVSRILVKEGDWVQPEQLLVSLDNGVLQSQVDSAVANVAEAEAALAKLKAGATASQMAAAEAEVLTAQASVTLSAGQMLEVQAAIDTATAQVNIAQQQYNELASHPTAAEQLAAKAEMAVAEAAVDQAQAAYNVVRGDPQIGSRPESMTLRQTTAALEAAKAKYTLTTQGPTPQQLAVAASNINAAKVQVAAAQSKAPGAEAAVKAAQANVASAQAALANLRAGATKEDMAMATAKVQSARAALASAQAAFRQSQITAPFAGQVGAINVRVGEQATTGQAVVLLGDTHTMHVATTDLRETDVVRLSVDLPVEVTFDALPGRTFTGKIVKVAPVSTAEKGSTNFTVQVDVNNLDANLRWGMTAFVNIQVAKQTAQAR